MKGIKIILVTIVLLALVILGIFFVVGYFKPSEAGLLIETNPASDVFINGEEVGRTKYEGVLKPGEVIIKLVPESFDKPLSLYETKVNLVSRVKTIIQRDFSDSEEKSSGAIVSFEKSNSQSAQVSVVSVPDSAEILFDGQVRGYAPLKLLSVTPGEHKIMVRAQGYKDKELNVVTYKGFKLTAIFQLASNPQEETPEPTEPSPTPEPELERVKILETDTGFLRVRIDPSTLAKEIGRVKPGEFYKLLDTDDETGWYKIEYKKNEEGWISNKYAKKESELQSPSSSPSPSVIPTSKPGA